MTNSTYQRKKENLTKRWLEEDYPGGTPRFQLSLLFKDIGTFFVLPLISILIFKMIENSLTGPKIPTRPKPNWSKNNSAEVRSQILSFDKSAGGPGHRYGFSKRAPGTLVKVKLLNTVETFSAAPVHAQIVDYGLGKEFIGGTILGEASSESSVGRININFRFARHPKRLDLAVPLSARAISLDGTYGVVANKKEGFFARAAIRSAATSPNAVDAGADKQDLKTLIARAVASGVMQEFQSDASVAHNNAQVWTLQPMTEFYVELTDYFPGQGQ